MTNREKYTEVFKTSFNVEMSMIQQLEYQSIPEWDSIGHLSLVANLEDAFGISIDIEDITELSSYVKGLEILSKYDLGF